MLDTENTDNPLAIPHFEDRLLERLHERQRTGGWSDAGDAPVGDAGRGDDRNGRRRWLVAAAAATVALLGGAAVMGTRDNDDGGQPDVDTAATARDPQVDEVLDAVDEAIASGTIVHTSIWDGEDEAWVDLRTGAERFIGPAGYEGRTMDWGRSEPPALNGERTPTDEPVPRRYVDNCFTSTPTGPRGTSGCSTSSPPPRSPGRR